MQPRTVTPIRNVVEQQVSRRALHDPAACLSDRSAEVHYTVQRPVTRTVWKDVTYTVTSPVRETHFESQVLHGLPAGQRDVVQDVHLQRLPRRSAR